jgi:hypothetical protein
MKQNIKEVDGHVSKYKEIIESLRTEIDTLKKQITNQNSIVNQFSPLPTSSDIDALHHRSTAQFAGENLLRQFNGTPLIKKSGASGSFVPRS